MDEIDLQAADGLAIMVLRIRDEERRQQLVHHLLNAGAERIAGRVFELSTADWDDGLWDEEIEWLTDALEGTRDTVVVYRFVGSKFARFTVGADA